MPECTASAPANLAFVKYWGKRDAALNLPANGSISMNLSGAQTITTVEFDPALASDSVSVEGVPAAGGFAARVSQHLDRLRALANVHTRARVETRNTFPSSVGIASSASGFAALTVAAAAALGLDLSERELSVLARFGSGSAARSIPSGYVEWLAGEDSDSSYAVQIAPPEHWPLAVVSVVVSDLPKRVSSTDGHAQAWQSPFFQQRLADTPARLEAVRAAILARNFTAFGQQAELEAMSLHITAMTSPVTLPQGWASGIYYWAPETLELILAVQGWRRQGLETYFTLDAGPTVHLITPAERVNEVTAAVRAQQAKQPGRAWKIMVNTPAVGAHVLSEGV